MLDKSWVSKPRESIAYRNGVEYFLNFAFANSAEGDQIVCPCVDCINLLWKTRDIVRTHLVVRGFAPKYNQWTDHGENDIEDIGDTEGLGDDDMHGLLNDVYATESGEESNDKVKEFFTLIQDADQELYPGCRKFSKLSFTIRVYLLKCQNRWSNASMDSLLSLLVEAFPDAKIPASYGKMKAMIKGLGLTYKKIHACPNDCMLYYGVGDEKLENCKKCGESRYKFTADSQGDSSEDGISSKKQIAAKIFRYFPLIPRLQRLFMSSKTAEFMRWHDEKRVKDGKLRHPADGQAWKDFDKLHPEFAADCRNIRLGIAADGFNPFRNMTSSHSTWPVIVSIYNLPPWMSMKPEYLILSSLIPGPKSPGNDIDVYLQPFVDELKTLWHEGVMTYDAHSKQMFNMHGCLMWSISDFPGLAMLSGWSTKGYFACPCCNYDTCSQYLYKSRKICYMGARRFLDAKHRWRKDKNSFDGKIELSLKPKPLSGSEIKEHLIGFINDFGKEEKKIIEKRGAFSKLSIFFELPYWEHNTLRHNLDVMHIEKNVCDNVLGTLLDIPGKTKDHLNARLDLKDMGIRKSLHPRESENPKKSKLVKACYTLVNHEKEIFCGVLKGAKVPDGCASNISHCVNVKEKKISGYKSHDAHFIMQYLLQVAIRRTLPKNVAITLIRLGSFFKAVCRKVIILSELDHLQTEIVETLCQLERIFPPSFFDIMVHLPIHLVEEIRLGGPVQTRWMYPIERFLGVLKDYVKNRSQPEACIAEVYLANECLSFCSRYLSEDGDTRFTRPSRNHEEIGLEENAKALFPIIGRPIVSKRSGKGKIVELENSIMDQARRYVLFNCEDNCPEISAYLKEYEQPPTKKRKGGTRWTKERTQSQDLVQWLESRVENDGAASDTIKQIAFGPNDANVQSFSGYIINGYRFHTLKHDKRRQTQSSGVTLTAMTSSFASAKDRSPVLANVAYYGAIEEILQLDYYGHFKIVLLKCKWFHSERDDYGLIRVNMKKLLYQNDPFVMANQVSQAFYVQDPVEQDWHYFMEAIPRDLFDMGAESSLDEAASSSQEFRVDALQNVVPVDNSDIQWSREDVDEMLVDNPEDTAMQDDRAPTEAEVIENEHSGEAEMREHVHKHSREAEMSDDDEDGFSSEEEPADDVDEYSD